MLAVARKFKGKPIFFIAVSSGTPKATVASYARRNRIRWPVIVDSDRRVEQTCGVPTVSLSNIYQMRVLTPAAFLTISNLHCGRELSPRILG